MLLMSLGINHKTTPVALRERLSFSPEQLDTAITELNTQANIDASVILSTCNRTEIYFAVNTDSDDASSSTKPQSDIQKIQTQVIDWMCEFHQLNESDKAEILNNLYLYKDEQAVEHLMRVACGLDSLILGEPQILGQVKQAFSEAKTKQKLPNDFNRWFEKTFSVAKRVRTETEIGANAVSVAFAACSLARQIFESLAELTVLLVGAGETIELVSRHLHQHGVGKMLITNRTYSRAKEVANVVDAEAFELLQLAERLSEADIVIASTASPNALIDISMVKTALKKRRNQPILMIDIAVPRDISPEVAELESVYLYSVDDLHSIIAHNQAQRMEAAELAEVIIRNERAEFMQWIASQQSSEAIREYRSAAEQIRQQLLEKALQSIQMGENPEIVLQQFSHRLTQRLLHPPTKALQEVAALGDEETYQKVSEQLRLTPP